MYWFVLPFVAIDGYIVEYDVKESRLITGKTGVKVGNNEGALDIQV